MTFDERKKQLEETLDELKNRFLKPIDQEQGTYKTTRGSKNYFCKLEETYTLFNLYYPLLLKPNEDINECLDTTHYKSDIESINVFFKSSNEERLAIKGLLGELNECIENLFDSHRSEIWALERKIRELEQLIKMHESEILKLDDVITKTEGES